MLTVRQIIYLFLVGLAVALGWSAMLFYSDVPGAEAHATSFLKQAVLALVGGAALALFVFGQSED